MYQPALYNDLWSQGHFWQPAYFGLSKIKNNKKSQRTQFACNFPKKSSNNGHHPIALSLLLRCCHDYECRTHVAYYPNTAPDCIPHVRRLKGTYLLPFAIVPWGLLPRDVGIPWLLQITNTNATRSFTSSPSFATTHLWLLDNIDHLTQQ